MARRAGRALAATLAVAGMAGPAALLASQAPAAAAASQPGQSLVSITITGLSRQWATPASTITVSGSLRNTSKQPDSHLTVQLLGSASPVSSVAELQQNVGRLVSPATATLRGASWHTSGQLIPGASVNWSIRVKASALGMTTFGVYPLAAQAQSVLGTALATGTTYLPYEPAKKGPYGTSRVAPAQISWVWPLIDKPQLNQPWLNNCTGSQASALATSLGTGGRLSELVRAGHNATGTTAGRSVTWAIDPALLANVRALATCRSSQPKWTRAAADWLTELNTATAGQPLFVTPYGDPNVAAFVAFGHGADVERSFQLGRLITQQILHRSMNPAATATTSSQADLIQAAGIAWPAGGVPSYGALENLANVDGVRTVMLSSSAVPAARQSVMRTLDGGGSYLNLLLASTSLTQLLGSTGATAGSAFTTTQQFLAETALLAQQTPAQPIVAAPPRRWDPPAGLAAELLAATASAPWLSPVSLTSLASPRNLQHGPQCLTSCYPPGTRGPSPVGKSGLRKLRTLDREIAQLQQIRARPDPDLSLAVSTVESSAWQSKSRSVAKAMLAMLANRVGAEQEGVQVDAETRITLGGLKGSVPVSIDNRLGYAVKVRLVLQYSQRSGIKIAADRPGVVLVPAHTAETIKLRVEALQVGSTTVTMSLASPDGQALSADTVQMTIQATQVGVLGMIIFAVALGIFLMASAARAVRRGRPAPAADQHADNYHADDHEDERSEGPARPDSVMAERTELGTAGTPGP